MFILILLFFKSICLFCQRLVLHIHDRWINPKNVRLFKEAVETKGTKVAIEEYRNLGKKTKKRRYATAASSSSLSHSLADSDNCRFCANTPQGYCRHHFHLQELQVQKQQKQQKQKIWCPLSGGLNRSNERRQLRQIKRELKQNIQQQKSAKLPTYNPGIYDYSYSSSSSSAPYSPPPPPSYESNSVNSFNDSGYQSITTVNNSTSLESENSGLLLATDQLSSSKLMSTVGSSLSDYVEIELPSPSASVVETTYSFETCCESPRSSSPLPKTTSLNSFMSCEYSAISTSYL